MVKTCQLVCWMGEGGVDSLEVTWEQQGRWNLGFREENEQKGSFEMQGSDPACLRLDSPKAEPETRTWYM